MGKHKNQQSLEEALQEFISKNKLQSGIDEVNVREAWDRVLGNGVKQYTQAVTLRRHVLYVNLSSSVLREELSLGNSKIIEMLNEDLGREVIQKLVLR
jgi:predicted nucleic acid-binding Zn ribbon protein